MTVDAVLGWIGASDLHMAIVVVGVLAFAWGLVTLLDYVSPNVIYRPATPLWTDESGGVDGDTRAMIGVSVTESVAHRTSRMPISADQRAQPSTRKGQTEAGSEPAHSQPSNVIRGVNWKNPTATGYAWPFDDKGAA